MFGSHMFVNDVQDINIQHSINQELIEYAYIIRKYALEILPRVGS